MTEVFYLNDRGYEIARGGVLTINLGLLKLVVVHKGDGTFKCDWSIFGEGGTVDGFDSADYVASRALEDAREAWHDTIDALGLRR